jgi:protein TonB
MPVYIVVEEMPSYKGGDEARIKFFIDNFTYPEINENENIQGSVYITFIIDTSGKVTNICVMRRQYTKLENECMRVISLMPNWNPGRQNGKNVNVRFNLPIKF